jgi:hypothetical protein
MPNKDGTGPERKGSMTGRKMGNCNTNQKDSFLRNKGLGLRKKANN